MQKLSEYIPLIIIVGSIFFSIVSSIRKKVKEVVILQQETQEPSVNIPQDAISQKNTRKIGKTPVKQMQEKWAQTTSGVRSADEESASNSESFFADTEESILPVFDILEGNEARKMIIYAEIINRKEY